MAPAELLEAFRRYVDDVQRPYLWKDEDVYAFMDEAQRVFVRDTNYLPGTLEIPVRANKPEVTIPHRLAKIRSARLAGTRRPVEVVTVEQMDRGMQTNDYGMTTVSDWENLKGEVTHLVMEVEQNTARLVSIPVRDDTLVLKVYLLPDARIKDHDSRFTVREDNLQRILLLHMAYQAFSFPGVDMFDERQSARNLAMFNDKVYEYAKANVRAKRKPGTVAYGGY